MKAIRVTKAKGLPKQHWLLDPERTLCGRKPDEYREVEQLGERKRLDPVEACLGCVRFAEGWTPDPPGHEGSTAPIHLSPSLGRIRTGGSLSHGTRVPRYGRRLT